VAADRVNSVHTSPVSGRCDPQPQRDDLRGAHLVKVLGVGTEIAVIGDREQRIAQIAGHQRGRIAQHQLVAVGVTYSTIRWMAARDRLLSLHRGVFAVGHLAPIELGAETAALLAVGEGAVLGSWSAARLWGLSPHSGDGLIHVVISGRRGPTLPGVAVHRTRILDSRDVRIRAGLPLLSPARALLDIAEQVTDRQLELAFDRGIVDKILRPNEVTELLSRTKGRRGGPRLASLVERQASGPSITRSEAEERLFALFRAAQLPEPMVNQRLHGYEVDFHWPAERFVVEVDGFRFHSTRRAFEHDRRKDATLKAAGLTTMRVTWRQIEEEPLALVARVAQALTWAKWSTRASSPSRTPAGPG
jgi:very-short-patch-repair endonuclease